MTRHSLDRAGLKADEGYGSAVTLIHRFGSAAINEGGIEGLLKNVIKDPL